jgi:group I intron endonuclease
MNTKFIYTLSDPNTGLIRYIGKTNNIKNRLRRHLNNSSLSESTKKNNWIISLLKNNQLPIIEVLEEVSSEDIDFYEMFYISLFKSWGFELLNGTNGGDGFDWSGRKHNQYSKLKNKINSPHRKSVAQFDLNGNLMNKYHSLREAALAVNGDRAHISRACSGKLKTSAGFKWKFIDRINKHNIKETKNRVIRYEKPRIDSRMKKIQVFDLKGNLLDVCRSLNETSNKYNCHTSLIKKCCEEKGYYQTKNLTFRYDGDIFDYTPYKHYRENRRYKIGMFSENNELIKSFDSLKDVVSYTKIGKQYISKNCKLNGECGLNKLKGWIFRFLK